MGNTYPLLNLHISSMRVSIVCSTYDTHSPYIMLEKHWLAINQCMIATKVQNLTCIVLWKSTKELFRIQGPWYSPDKLHIMVHDHALRIIA